MPNLTAKISIVRLSALRFDPNDADLRGPRMGEIFRLRKEFAVMPVAEIEVLMDSSIQQIPTRLRLLHQ